MTGNNSYMQLSTNKNIFYRPTCSNKHGGTELFERIAHAVATDIATSLTPYIPENNKMVVFVEIMSTLHPYLYSPYTNSTYGIRLEIDVFVGDEISIGSLSEKKHLAKLHTSVDRRYAQGKATNNYTLRLVSHLNFELSANKNDWWFASDLQHGVPIVEEKISIRNILAPYLREEDKNTTDLSIHRFIEFLTSPVTTDKP